jgi:hypothetical protein
MDDSGTRNSMVIMLVAVDVVVRVGSKGGARLSATHLLPSHHLLALRGPSGPVHQ